MEYIELQSDELQTLKWLLAGAAPKRSDAHPVLKSVHITPKGALETLNRFTQSPDLQVRIVSPGASCYPWNLRDKLYWGMGHVEGFAEEPHPDKAVVITKAGRTTEIGGVLPGEEYPRVDPLLPDEKTEPTFALDPVYLKNLLSGFDGKVEVMIQDKGSSPYVNKPLSFRGKTKTGKLAYAILMPMHLGR